MIAAALLTRHPQAEWTAREYRAAQAALPAADPDVPGRDSLSRQAISLTHEVTRLSEQARGFPSGHTRMAELYELWAMLTFARAAGAAQGEFGKDRDGLYTGRLYGEGVEVQLNLNLGFSGVGPARQFARPDLLLLRGSEALVADVKYRPLHRMTTDQVRGVNDQILRYMGLTHARTGLAVWPGTDDEPFMLGELPGNRARLGRLRLHPLDSSESFITSLQQLTFQGDL